MLKLLQLSTTEVQGKVQMSNLNKVSAGDTEGRVHRH